MENKNKPIVSIIMCVYNALDTMEESILSVLNQTERNFELLLVDDGSTDGSSEKCDEFAAADGRVRVIHQSNKGLSVARNTGLKEASGENIAWLDADDTLMPDMLELMLNIKQKYGVRYVKSNYSNLKNGNETVRFPDIKEDTVVDTEKALAMLARNDLTPVVWSSIAEKELYDGIEFPVGHMFEDVRTTYKLIERAGRIALLAKPTTLRLVLDTSISHKASVANRVDGCLAYIERYSEITAARPAHKRALITYDFKRAMVLLRQNIYRCSYSEFKKCRSDIRKICRFYGDNSAYIFPKKPGLAVRISFRLMTSGTYAGFYLSRIADYLNIRNRNWIVKLSVPYEEH